MEKSFWRSSSNDLDQSNEFSSSMWGGNLSNMGLESLGLMPAERRSMPDLMSKRPYELDPAEGEKQASSPTADQPWTLERFIHHVRHEMAVCHTRLTRLEQRVQQLTIQLRSSHPSRPVSLNESRAGGLALREISRSHLDRYCLRTLEANPEPNSASLSSVAQRIAEDSTFDHLDHKTIMSQIRKWFRKRREEMGTRLVSALKRRHLRQLASQAEIDQLYNQIRTGSFDLAPIMAEAKLEIINDEEALVFSRHKLLSFLDRYRVFPEE